MWDNGDGRWQYMHDQDGVGWVMVVLMLVFVAAVVVAVVALLRGTVPRPGAPQSTASGRASDPRAILQERFARGDIEEEDFRARMRALDDTTG